MTTPWRPFQGQTPNNNLLQQQQHERQRGNNNDNSSASSNPPLPEMRFMPIAPFGGTAKNNNLTEKRRNNRAWYTKMIDCFSKVKLTLFIVTNADVKKSNAKLLMVLEHAKIV
jgi:hypothetical protein